MEIKPAELTTTQKAALVVRLRREATRRAAIHAKYKKERHSEERRDEESNSPRPRLFRSWDGHGEGAAVTGLAFNGHGAAVEQGDLLYHGKTQTQPFAAGAGGVLLIKPLPDLVKMLFGYAHAVEIGRASCRERV